MSRRRKSSSRGRPSRASKKQPSLWQKLKGWRPSWRPRLRLELGPVQRQMLGLGLLLLVVVTLLGLLGISSGSALGWWAKAMRRTFGWVALPVVLSVGLFGLRLL